MGLQVGKTKKLLSNIKANSIRTKLMAYFLLLSMLPIIIFVFSSGNYYIKSWHKNVTTYTYEVIERINKNIETYISDIDNILNMRTDYYLLQYLKLNNSNDIDGNRKYTTRIWENFNNSKQMKTDLADIRIIASNGQTISSYGSYWTDIRYDGIYQEFINDPNKEVALAPPTISRMNRSVFTIGKAIHSENLSGLAVMCIDIDTAFLDKICNEIRLGSTGYIMLLDENGQMVYSPNDSPLNQQIAKSEQVLRQNNGSFVQKIDNANYIITFKSSQKTGWKIIGITLESEMTKEIVQIKRISLFVILACILVVLLLTAYITSIITNPIRELRGLMKRASENELSVHAKIKTKDEIGQLAQSFNIMIDRIKMLMDKIVEDQKQIRMMETKAMQELIKPHFVYNTLDSIIGLLEQSRNEDAMDLVETLGKFFRASLSHGKEVILLREEIENVKSYLAIQQFRFSGKFDYMIDVNEEMLGLKTIKFVLQPLVENAVYHGVRGLDKKGRIVIEGYVRDDELVLEVLDNGAQMKEEKLSHINRVLAGDEPVESEGVYFGIRNVNDRIRLRFGKNFGLSYSCDQTSTKATIRQPLLDEGTAHV